MTCPEDLLAAINPPLLEQAVINLIDNAIKYSPAEQAIAIDAIRGSGAVMIRVQDHGCGIGREHLGRIFERFYRVDPARSRKLGGTGLGLAIVKHIAQSHGGRATVESAVGQGSTFAIHLPINRRAVSEPRGLSPRLPGLAQARQQPRHVGRQRHGKRQRLAPDRMVEPQFGGVQGLSRGAAGGRRSAGGTSGWL